MIKLEALEFLCREALGSSDRETGGILIGFHAGCNIHIIRATGPGPNAVRTPGYFLRDTRFCYDALLSEYKQSGADYVGEWHSHVIDFRQPSLGDILTIANVCADPDYNFPSFAVLLAVVQRSEIAVKAYMAIPSQDRREVRIEELPLSLETNDEQHSKE